MFFQYLFTYLFIYMSIAVNRRLSRSDVEECPTTARPNNPNSQTPALCARHHKGWQCRCSCGVRCGHHPQCGRRELGYKPADICGGKGRVALYQKPMRRVTMGQHPLFSLPLHPTGPTSIPLRTHIVGSAACFAGLELSIWKQFKAQECKAHALKNLDPKLAFETAGPHKSRAPNLRRIPHLTWPVRPTTPAHACASRLRVVEESSDSPRFLRHGPKWV